ncbi:MAG: hypothetical protein EOM88_03200 [Clostridia bacterium]|nr:hypothetical protein [Clostridia bacterium]
MNVYIYDDFLNKSRYRRTLGKIEIRLTDLGLNGKIIRLGSIKNVKDLIQAELKNGVKNFTAVGNNNTVIKVVSALVSNKAYDFFQKEILFSIIPIGENNSIANSLGIKKGQESCNIILARRIKTVDLAWAGTTVFLGKAELKTNYAEIEIDEKYKIEIEKNINAQILNISDIKNLINIDRINPNDKKLNISINKGKDTTYIASNNIQIHGSGELLLDTSLVESLPVKLGILKQKLNIVVGKTRNFH